jgi:hypothetical protein
MLGKGCVGLFFVCVQSDFEHGLEIGIRILSRIGSYGCEGNLRHSDNETVCTAEEEWGRSTFALPAGEHMGAAPVSVDLDGCPVLDDRRPD